MARLKSFRQIPVILAICIFFAPPIVFSQNLPTVCTIFFKKQGEPSGPCGHKALFPKLTPLEFGMELVPGLVPERGRLLFAPAFLPDHPLSFAVQFNSIPLRC